MKIVLAFDSFKGTLSSKEIAKITKKELLNKNKNIEITSLEIGDGGEGSLNAIINQIGGKKRYKRIFGPDFHKIWSSLGVKGDSCFIESADVVGFKYKKNDTSPSNYSTYGIGELIKKALDLNMKNIYICLGGTITNDGGCGMAAALGAKFLNKKREVFIPKGISLQEIDDVILDGLDKRLNDVNIYGLSDVVNPLYGTNGASYVFGPQKGANIEEVALMDKGLINLSKILVDKYQIDYANSLGAGAAGGLGFGIYAFLNGSLKKGIETILDLYKFNDIIRDADYIFTGEGKLDSQSFQGKVIDGIIKRASVYNTKIIGVFGIIEQEEYKDCFYKVFETNNQHLPFEEVKKHAKEDLIKTIKKIDL